MQAVEHMVHSGHESRAMISLEQSLQRAAWQLLADELSRMSCLLCVVQQTLHPIAPLTAAGQCLPTTHVPMHFQLGLSVSLHVHSQVHQVTQAMHLGAAGALKVILKGASSAIVPYRTLSAPGLSRFW